MWLVHWKGHADIHDLVTNYDIPQKHFFKYIQIRDFIKSKQNGSLVPPTLTILEEIVSKHLSGRGQISILYQALVDGSKESTNILKAWNSDMGGKISEEEWKACFLVKTQSLNTQSKLLQHEWLTRQYITPAKLHHYKCNYKKGSLFHCMWDCLLISHFWRNIILTVGKIISCTYWPKVMYLKHLSCWFHTSNF